MNILGWAKVLETSTLFLEKAVEAGIQHWRLKYTALLEVSKEMMAEIRNKTQACEALSCTLNVRDKRIEDLERMVKERDEEIVKITNLMEDRK